MPSRTRSASDRAALVGFLPVVRWSIDSFAADGSPDRRALHRLRRSFGSCSARDRAAAPSMIQPELSNVRRIVPRSAFAHSKFWGRRPLAGMIVRRHRTTVTADATSGRPSLQPQHRLREVLAGAADRGAAKSRSTVHRTGLEVLGPEAVGHAAVPQRLRTRHDDGRARRYAVRRIGRPTRTAASTTERPVPCRGRASTTDCFVAR